MPQLEFSTYAPQLVWLVITFAILYVILARMVLPRIAEVLDSRQERIADDLEDAENLKKEAEGALQAYEKALQEARDKAHALAAKTQAAMAEEAARRSEDLQNKLAAEAAQADQRIREMRDRAVADIRVVARDTAQAVTAKLIGVDVPTGDAAVAVDAEVKGS